MSDKMQELWREIGGHPGYQVSNLGRVRSEWICGRGKRRILGNWRILAGARTPYGYRQVDFQGKKRFIHHLVLEAFVGARPAGHECCHGDDERSNNVVTNLRWGTRQDNVDDKERSGHTLRGETHGSSKLRDSDVIEIRRRVASGEMQKVIAAEFGIHQVLVSMIHLRKRWGHL